MTAVRPRTRGPACLALVRISAIDPARLEIVFEEQHPHARETEALERRMRRGEVGAGSERAAAAVDHHVGIPRQRVRPPLQAIEAIWRRSRTMEHGAGDVANPEQERRGRADDDRFVGPGRRGQLPGEFRRRRNNRSPTAIPRNPSRMGRRHRRTSPRETGSKQPDGCASVPSLPPGLERAPELLASEPNPCVDSASGCSGAVSPSASESPSTSETPIRFFSRSMVRISNAPRVPRGPTGTRPIRSTRRRERRRVRQRLDSRLQFDERPEFREARDDAGPHLPHLVPLGNRRPRVGGELLQPKRNLLAVFVNAQDLDGDLIRPGARISDASDTRDHPISEMWSKPSHAGPEIDKRAEIAHRGHATGQHGAGDDRLRADSSTA